MTTASRQQPERRYLFDAQATTLRGKLTRPDPVTFDSSRTLTLPLAGGDDKSDDNEVSFGGVLSIGKSSSVLDGRYNEKTDTYDTTIVTTVHDVNILDGRLTAKLIEARLTSSYSAKDGERTFSIEGSRIEDLVIEGEKASLNFDDKPFRKKTWRQLMQEVDTDKGLRGRMEEKDPEVGGRKDRGLVMCSLCSPGAFKNGKTTVLPGACVKIENFGRIWLTELMMTPDRWRLTMLRAKLGSPAEGEFEIGDASANGQRFPP